MQLACTHSHAPDTKTLRKRNKSPSLTAGRERGIETQVYGFLVTTKNKNTCLSLYLPPHTFPFFLFPSANTKQTQPKTTAVLLHRVSSENSNQTHSGNTLGHTKLTHTLSHAHRNVPFPISLRAVSCRVVRTSRPLIRFFFFTSLRSICFSWGYRNRHTTLEDTLAPRAAKGVVVVVVVVVPQARGSCHQNLWHASSAVVSVVVVPCRLSIIVRQKLPE